MYPLLRDVVRVNDDAVKKVVEEYVKSAILTFWGGDIVVIPRGGVNASPSMVSSFDFCPLKRGWSIGTA